MASALQPLGMISTLLEKRLQSSSPDIAAVAKNSIQLKTVAREASSTCMGLMTWLAPEANAVVSLSAGIEEATGLIANEFSFNGFTLVNRVGDVQARVPRSLTRNTLLAALIALTDSTTAPANVVLDAQFADNALVLVVSIEPAQGESLTSGVPPYRKLGWEDVQALAELESVGLAYTANSVTLRLPLVLDAVQS